MVNSKSALHQFAPPPPPLQAPLDGFLSRAVVCAAMNLFSFEKYLEFLGELSHSSEQTVVGLEDLFNSLALELDIYSLAHNLCKM